MSVKDRIDDARLLYAHGRSSGALLSILVAVAATARKRYPRQKKKGKTGYSDRESFERFVHEEMSKIAPIGTLNLGFRGTMRPLQAILYEFVRCEMAHEAQLPPDIKFIKAPPGQFSVQGSPSGLTLSDTIFDGLAEMVLQAPENAAVFAVNPAIIRATHQGKGQP